MSATRSRAARGSGRTRGASASAPREPTVHTNTIAASENATDRDPPIDRTARSRRSAIGRRTASAYGRRSRASDAPTRRARLRRCGCSSRGVRSPTKAGSARRLAPGVRLVLLKADGSIAIHSDAKAYKPLNWMSPPCTIVERDDTIVATNPKGETLEITLHEVLHDTSVELGDDPGLEKDGVEAELQQLLAARVAALRDDFVLVRREFPTDIGPIDLLCRDGDGRAVVVEVKRVGEIAGVDQLLRYQERLDRDPQYAPTAGMLVAQQIKPQARVYAESKGVACVEIDLARLRGDVDPDLKLF